jgi:hypothetical protein
MVTPQVWKTKGPIKYEKGPKVVVIFHEVTRRKIIGPTEYEKLNCSSKILSQQLCRDRK